MGRTRGSGKPFVPYLSERDCWVFPVNPLEIAASGFLGLNLTIFVRSIGGETMIKVTWAILLVCALLVVGPLSDYAAGGGHSHSQFFFSGSIALGPWGPGYGGYPGYSWYPAYPYAYYPAPYYAAPYYAAPPVVIQQQPQVYSQPQQQQSDYWYYCQNPQGYYPYVKSCPGGWMRVVPEPAPPQYRY